MPYSQSNVAFAFDIDGVLVRGTEALPQAKETLQMLQSKGIPFIFLTNGGGQTEASHIANLEKRLGLSLSERQIVQSHTPYHDLKSRFQDKTVLVLGGHGQNVRKLAHDYGFNKVVTASDIMLQQQHIHPFPEMTAAHHAEHGRPYESPLNDTRIHAILVWSSPRDWCVDMQVVTDLLLSEGGVLGTVSKKNGDPNLDNWGFQQDNQPELYFCNPDLEWATKHEQPRFAQGAFRKGLEGIWNDVTESRKKKKKSKNNVKDFLNVVKDKRIGKIMRVKKLISQRRAAKGKKVELLCTQYGKPTAETYRYAENTLLDFNNNASADDPPAPIKTVYMVGDNPASDIAGANAHKSQNGLTWRSVLVESGVYVSGTTPAHQPTHIAKNVKEAVDWALMQENH